MPTVDSKGRIVLPKAVRERLGIAPGTEVEVREEDGTVVVEPEDDPERILERMERLVEETSSRRGRTRPIEGTPDPVARKHTSSVRSGVETDDDE